MATSESEFTAVLSRVSESRSTTEGPSFFNNSCSGLQETSSSESGGKSMLDDVSSTKQKGGARVFTFCVPGCFSNNKRNPELSFYNFPGGQNKKSLDLQKKWTNLISRKDFIPTTGHGVCPLHFSGGRKM